MSNTDSLKEVHRGDGMEVVQPAPEVVPNHGRIRKYWYEGGDDFNGLIANEPSRIFGMRRVTLLLAIAIIIMVGIIIGLSVGLTKGVHQRNGLLKSIRLMSAAQTNDGLSLSSFNPYFKFPKPNCIIRDNLQSLSSRRRSAEANEHNGIPSALRVRFQRGANREFGPRKKHDLRLLLMDV